MADIEFKNSVNANNAYVDGHKVQLIAVPDGNLELPISANDDSGYVVDANGKKHKVMLATFLSGIIDYKNSSNADSAYMTIDGQKVKVTLAAKLNGTQQLFDSPTSSNAYAEDDEGEKHRVTLVATPSGTLELPTSETYNYAYLIDGNGNKHRVRMFALIAGGYEEVIVRGVAPLSLPNAIADGLHYVKAFGGTEQASTPTPSSPVDIVCNNGAIKYGQHGKNLFDINNAVRITRATSTEIPLDETPTITIENNGFVLGTPYHLYFTDYMIPFAGQTNTQYTLSVKQMAGVDEVGIAFIYSDETVSRIRYRDTTLTYRTYTSDANKTVVGFALDYGNGSQTLTLQDIQIELGTAATSFEPYYFGLYTDGTVETINVHGKNLFDVAHSRVAVAGVLQADGSYYLAQAVSIGIWTPGNRVPFSGKPGVQYTLSAKIKNTVADSSITLGFAYSDNTWEEGAPRGDFQDYTEVSVTSDPNKTVIAFGALYHGGTDDIFLKDLQIELGTTATEYEPYFDGGTATAEMLLKVDNYTDVQDILSGTITRNVGIKALDGTENWVYNSSQYPTFSLQLSGANGDLTAITCTHFAGHSGTWASMPDGSVMLHGTNLGFRYDNITSLNDWKQWLVSQYNNGTPVIIVYPLATPTTESVAGQSLIIADGDNIVDITEASMNNLELEVKYTAGVILSVQEVEDAQLSPDVEVIIQ